jgi:hypothetical protein
MGLHRNSVNAPNTWSLSLLYCFITTYDWQQRARGTRAMHFFVALVLVHFKNIFNKYFIKIFFFHAIFNVYRYLSVLVNFLDKV